MRRSATRRVLPSRAKPTSAARVAADAAALDKLRLELASSRANESALRKQLTEAHAAAERVTAELAAERAVRRGARRRRRPRTVAVAAADDLVSERELAGLRRRREISAHENRRLTVELLRQNDTVSQLRAAVARARSPSSARRRAAVAGAGTGAAREPLNLHAVVDAVAPSPPPAAAAAGALRPPGGAAPRQHAARRDAAAGGVGVGRRVVAAGCLACGAAGGCGADSGVGAGDGGGVAAGVVAAGGWPTRLCSEGGRLNGAALTSDGRRLWSAADSAARCGCASGRSTRRSASVPTRLASPRGRCAPRRRRVRRRGDDDPPLYGDGGAAGRALRGRRHQARPRARGRARGRRGGATARRRARRTPPLRRRRRLRARLRAPLRADGLGRRAIAGTVLLDGGGAGGTTSVRALAACQLPSEGLPGAAGRALLAGGDEGVVRAFSLRDGGGCGRRSAGGAGRVDPRARLVRGGEGGGGARLGGAPRPPRRAHAAAGARLGVHGADGELGSGAAPRRPRCRRVDGGGGVRRRHRRLDERGPQAPRVGRRRRRRLRAAEYSSPRRRAVFWPAAPRSSRAPTTASSLCFRQTAARRRRRRGRPPSPAAKSPGHRRRDAAVNDRRPWGGAPLRQVGAGAPGRPGSRRPLSSSLNFCSARSRKSIAIRLPAGTGVAPFVSRGAAERVERARRQRQIERGVGALVVSVITALDTSDRPAIVPRAGWST